MNEQGYSVPYEERWCIAEKSFWFYRIGTGYSAIYSMGMPSKQRVEESLSVRKLNLEVIEEPRYYIHDHAGCGNWFDAYDICKSEKEFIPCLERLSSIRHFKTWFDNSFFIFYDDAEVRMRNMQKFVLWCKQALDDPKLTKKRASIIQKDYRKFFRTEWLTPENIKIRNSMSGLKESAPRRSNLKGLAKEMACARFL